MATKDELEPVTPVRILLADDHELVRRGLRSLLASHAYWTICGEAVDGNDAVEKARRLKPDLIILDISMPNLNGLDAARLIKQGFPESEILILSQHDSPEVLRTALDAGARGYVLKSEVATCLIGTIEEVLQHRHAPTSTSTQDLPREIDSENKPTLRSVYARGTHAQRWGEWQQLVEGAQWGAALLDPDSHTLLNANRAFAQVHGYVIDDLLGKSLVELVDAAERDKVQRRLADPEKQDYLWYEAQHVRFDGSRFPVHADLTAYRDPAGLVLFHGVTLQDITDLREAEQELALSQAGLNLALTGAGMAMFDLDAATMTLKWSGQPDQVFGLSSWRNSGVLEDWEGLIDEADRGKVEQEIQDLLIGKRSDGACEYRVRRPNGQRVWVKSRFQAIGEADGRATRLLAVSGEIVERTSTISPTDAQLIGDGARAESGDRPIEEHIADPAIARESDQGDTVTDARGRLLDLANDAIFIRSSDNKISYWNAGAERLYGWTKGEVLGRAPADFLKTEFPIPFEELSRRERWEGELRQRTRDGGMIVVSSRWSSLRDQEGRLTGWLEINTDMTRQKNAEAAARRLSARLLQMQDEERRRIARELHDSLGQYLTSLKINQDLLSRDEASMTAERRRTLLQESLEIIDQCLTETRTISHLLHPPLLDEAGFASAARWFVDGFAQRSGIQVELELDPDLGRLPTEVEIALFRVLQETLTNVHRHSGSATAEIRLQIDAESVQLQVCDRGLGISQEQLRGFRRATPEVGIGLAGMRERIRELGGTLELRSGSTGTTITVTVPLHEQAIAASDSAR